MCGHLGKAVLPCQIDVPLPYILSIFPQLAHSQIRFRVSSIAKQSNKGVGSCRVFGLFWRCCQKNPYSFFNFSNSSEHGIHHEGYEGKKSPFWQKIAKMYILLSIFSLVSFWLPTITYRESVACGSYGSCI